MANRGGDCVSTLRRPTSRGSSFSRTDIVCIQTNYIDLISLRSQIPRFVAVKASLIPRH